jgi:GNAT superfamily N-acetyltransferase
LTVEENPDPKEVQFLDDRIYEYNAAQTGIDDGRLLAVFLRDDKSQPVGGLYGWTWGGCLEVKLLWVRDDLRGMGYGKRLMLEAERAAIDRGCFQALLDTHGFQAPDFYIKLGYEVYGVLEGPPAGQKKYYLKKNLKGVL